MGTSRFFIWSMCGPKCDQFVLVPMLHQRAKPPNSSFPFCSHLGHGKIGFWLFLQLWAWHAFLFNNSPKHICLFAIRGWGVWSRAHEQAACKLSQHGCAINTQIIGYLLFCDLWLEHQLKCGIWGHIQFCARPHKCLMRAQIVPKAPNGCQQQRAKPLDTQ